jgi:hypothetical protein
VNTNTTREPIVVQHLTEAQNWKVNDLPKRQRKAFNCVVRKGIPLNKRMRRIWEDIQRLADACEVSNWLAEHDGWGME